jgi:hypothetical protein
MNKKGLLLLLGGCLLSGNLFAQDFVLVDPGFQYVGPNYSGYYNYAPGAPYSYVGPNYSGYYNYPFVGFVDTVAVVGVDVVSVVYADPCFVTSCSCCTACAVW